MSVRTTADEKLDSAREHLKQAYKDLLVFADEDTWGYSEFTNSFIENIIEVTFELRKLRIKLT